MLKMVFKDKNDLESQLINFRVDFAYNSNRIENENTTYHDIREVFENGKVVGFNGDLKTLNEIHNQKNCYNFLLEKIVNRDSLSVALIKEIHKKLTNGTYDEVRYSKGERPGEFKKGDYIVGKNEVGSKANIVENEIEELLDEINNSNSDDYLTIASYMHCRFENIHPFADGNGRVGRTILNYYLMINGIKPLVIYDEDKKYYYECLQKYDEEEEIEPLKKFLEYSQEKTWKNKSKNYKKLLSFL